MTNYTYDDNGNRVSRTTDSTTENGVYDDQDRLVSYGTATYDYDVSGDLTRKTDSGVTDYVYDEFGNFISATLTNGNEIEYVIDGENRRICKKVNGTLVQGFLYKDSLFPVAELDCSVNLVSYFVF